MTYLLDTDWLIDIIAGRQLATSVIEDLNPDHLYISIVSQGELFKGAFGYSRHGRSTQGSGCIPGSV